MDGLEKIIRKIEEDADISSASVISDAEAKAAEIIAEAESAGDAEARDIIASAKHERETMIRKAHSNGELLRKNKILSRKCEIMDSTISKAVTSFLREDPEKYFDAMLRLCKKYAMDGKQDMIFCDRDMARLPADYEKRIKSIVGERSRITLRGGGDFLGGFMLVSSEMIENCTVEALVEDADTDIRDELCKLLFAQ